LILWSVENGKRNNNHEEVDTSKSTCPCLSLSLAQKTSIRSPKCNLHPSSFKPCDTSTYPSHHPRCCILIHYTFAKRGHAKKNPKPSYFASSIKVPSPPSKYKEIHALTFFWKEDDLDLIEEVSAFGLLLKAMFNFASVVRITIPSRNPYEYVERTLNRWKELLSHPDHLLLVYYSGHEFMDEFGRMMWRPYA
jgi:hypothetical protein